jgi:hypothetical protein
MGRQEHHAMSSEEARQTLKTLEQLIALAVWIGVQKPAQRAALQALKRRRTAMKKLLAARTALAPQPVVQLADWRKAGTRAAPAATRYRACRDARARPAAL